MASVKYFEALGTAGDLTSKYDFPNLALQEDASSDSASYIEYESGYRITVEGKDLGYIQNSITEGTISKITFSNPDDEALLTIAKAKKDAGDAFDAFAEKGLDAMFALLLAGNDKITGSKGAESLDGYAGNDIMKGGSGDDYLYGHAGEDRLSGDKGKDMLFGMDGNDRLTGGKNSDQFSFYGTTNKDVITDFDAKGGGDRQDYLHIYVDKTFAVKVRGDDLLIKFDDGDQIRLLDVRLKDFDCDDDVIYF